MAEDLYQSLLNSGFRFVSYRPRSEKETRNFLENKLKRKKAYFDPKILEKVIARLKELNYLDDTKFARWWIEQRALYKPKGRRLISQELKSKGVSSEVIKAVMQNENCQFTDGRSQNDSFPSDKQMALNALRRKIEIWKKLPLLERRKKIYGFLGRRGFFVETIEAVIDEIGSFGVK